MFFILIFTHFQFWFWITMELKGVQKRLMKDMVFTMICLPCRLFFAYIYEQYHMITMFILLINIFILKNKDDLPLWSSYPYRLFCYTCIFGVDSWLMFVDPNTIINRSIVTYMMYSDIIVSMTMYIDHKLRKTFRKELEAP